MAEKALTAVIQEAYIHGVSKRAVDDRVKALGMSGVSKSQVSRLCTEIDERVAAFLEEDGADQSGYGGLVWEDAHHLGAALDLAVQPLDGIGGVQLRPVLLGERHVGEDVRLRFVHEVGQFRNLRPELVGNASPLLLHG